MKLHINFSNSLNIENRIIKGIHFSYSKLLFKNKILKTKLTIQKLYPQHWFDGIWDDLDYKL